VAAPEAVTDEGTSTEAIQPTLGDYGLKEGDSE